MHETHGQGLIDVRDEDMASLPSMSREPEIRTALDRVLSLTANNTSSFNNFIELEPSEEQLL